MICPVCGGKTKILETRETKRGTRRRHECWCCHHRFTTIEIINLAEKMLRQEVETLKGTFEAAPVVRCKDCTHGSKNEDGSISCNCFMVDSMPPTGFCSFGDKKVTLRMIKNPDTEAYETATAAVKANDGYCPCLIYKTPDTKCPCKDFREQEVEGECHCGRYVKITE